MACERQVRAFVEVETVRESAQAVETRKQENYVSRFGAC